MVGRRRKLTIDIEGILDDVIRRNIDPSIFSEINESHIPKAKNCVEFFFSRKFHNTSPLPRQLQICLNLFEELCPHCSNMNVANNMFDQKMSYILDSITPLDFGICPKCGITKYQLYKQGLVHYKTMLRGCAGQRCVTGDTIVLTEDGLVPISHYAKDKSLGWNEQDIQVYNGESFKTSTKFYVGDIDDVKEIILENGFYIRGTLDHPVMDSLGEMLKLSEYYIGDRVKIQIGDDIWKNETQRDFFLKYISDCLGSLEDNSIKFNNKLHGALLNFGYEHNIKDNKIIFTNNQLQEINNLLLRKKANKKVLFLKIKDCKLSREQTYDFHIPDSHRFWSNSFLSSNSGKSYLVTEFIWPYILHRYLTLGQRGNRMTPQQYFGLLPNTTLRMSAIALTVGKAQDLLFTPFVNSLKNSPWFKKYHNFLREQEEELGRPILFEGVTHLFYQHKLIACGPQAPDTRKLRGDTRIFEATDEIDYFDTDEASTKVTMSAEEIDTSLNNSLRTVRTKAEKFYKTRYHFITGYSAQISSPSSVDGKILREVAKAERVKKISSFHYSSWEMNPDYTFESLKEEFDKNSVVAWRDFGAVPPLASDPFFTNIKSLKKSCRTEEQNLLRTKIDQEKDIFGNQMIWLQPSFSDTPANPMLLTVDIGTVANGFSAILSHLTPDEKIILDYIIALDPSLFQEEVQIDYDKMYRKLIVPMLKRFNIVHVAYDRWNSLQSIQNIKNEYKIPAESYTLKIGDFDNIVLPALEEPGMISYPKPKINIDHLNTASYNKDFSGFQETLAIVNTCPVSSLLLQCLTVRKVGLKVTKPLKGNDDIFRALALIPVFLLDEDLKGKFKSGNLKKNSRGTRVGAVCGFNSSFNSNSSSYNSVGRTTNTTHRSPMENSRMGRIVRRIKKTRR